MTCETPGCPCLLNWRGHRPGEPRSVDADDMDVSAVLRRRDQPGAPGAGLSWHDKFRVFLILEARGYNARPIARALGCSDRTIVRWRGKIKALEASS